MNKRLKYLVLEFWISSLLFPLNLIVVSTCETVCIKFLGLNFELVFCIVRGEILRCRKLNSQRLRV